MESSAADALVRNPSGKGFPLRETPFRTSASLRGNIGGLRSSRGEDSRRGAEARRRRERRNGWHPRIHVPDRLSLRGSVDSWMPSPCPGTSAGVAGPRADAPRFGRTFEPVGQGARFQRCNRDTNRDRHGLGVTVTAWTRDGISADRRSFSGGVTGLPGLLELAGCPPPDHPSRTNVTEPFQCSHRHPVSPGRDTPAAVE
jgi:hypothetical protein